jgi:hypothetical protein
MLPFNKSSLQGRELEFIFQTITHGQIAGDQTFSKKCHGLYSKAPMADYKGLMADRRRAPGDRSSEREAP